MAQPLSPIDRARLEPLGWTPALDEAWATQPEGLVPGRVSLEHNHVYRVMTAEGEWLAETAGKIKFEAEGRHELPGVGDWVGVRPDEGGSGHGEGRALIRAILPRRSWFSRKAAGRGTTEQVLAANVDVVFLTFGLDVHVKERAIERYLVVARRSGARPVIVLNKADVSPDLDADVSEAVAVAGGAPVHAVRAKEPGGVAPLEAYLGRGVTLAFLGPSGAGKSSITNALIGRELLATGEVRDWDGRGRHTSVHRELVVRERGGLIIDTPGMRELQLWGADDVVDTFADIAALAEGCKFRDCQHDREPGCAVKRAVEDGALDAGRYAGFLKLQAEQAALERLVDERALIDAKRQGKIGSKALKSHYKLRDKNR